MISDDLTATLSSWATQVERVYGDTPPVAEVTVTVVAATGVSLLDQPFWVAAVAGVADQTGTSTPLEAAAMQAPAGAPSWQSDPLTLAVHDPTADLLLLLCEAGGTSALNACVGRAVVPLSELLPLLPVGCCAQPAALESWVDVFPPSAEYAEGCVQPQLGAALDDVDGTGMARPAHKGRALVRVCLTAHRSLMRAYLEAPAFDALQGASGEARASRVAVPPERMQMAAARVHALLAGLLRPPACVRLAGKRPWTSGGLLLLLIGWMSFAPSLLLLPWWLLAAGLLNGYSLSALYALDLPPSPWTPVPISVEEGGRAPAAVARLAQSVQADLAALRTPDERLERLEAAVLPLLERVEETASAAERLLAACMFADPRASVLAAGPAVALCAAISLVLAIASTLVAMVGGLSNAVFGGSAVAVVLNILSFHRTELYAAWQGDDAQAAAGHGGRIGPGSPAPPLRFTTDSPRYGDDDDDELLNSERRAAIATWARSTFAWVGHVWGRLPDEPSRCHRQIARAAIQSAAHADKGRVFPPLF